MMRQLMGQRCGLVRASNPCRCDGLVRASVDAGILDPADPRWTRHAGVTLPIDTTTLDTAARELDLAVAVADVYRSDPPFAAPEAVWAGLARALPTLLAPPGQPSLPARSGSACQDADLAYDEGLAARLRDLIGAEPGLAEKEMFGWPGHAAARQHAVDAHGEGMIARTTPPSRRSCWPSRVPECST